MRRLPKMFAFLTGAVVAGALLVAAADPAEAPQPRARIYPSVVRVAPSGQQQFRVSSMVARLEGATTVHNVKWSVNDVVGGSPEFGTIDANGLYNAPGKTPVPGEIRIGAEVEGVANRYAWATVTMGNGKPSYRLVRGWGEPIEQAGQAPQPAWSDRNAIGRSHHCR